MVSYLLFRASPAFARLLLFVMIFCWLSSFVVAADEDRDRKARVALALAAAKEPAVATSPALAPMPRPKQPSCPCGESCRCPAGKCPACPAVGGLLSALPTTAPAQPIPTAPRVLYYRQVCDGGRCYLIPVYESPALPTPTPVPCPPGR